MTFVRTLTFDIILREDFGLAEIEKMLTCSTSKPFSQKSEREKDELFEKIAEQLTIIADHYNLDSPLSPPLLYTASQNKESEEKIPENPSSIGNFEALCLCFLHGCRICRKYSCFLSFTSTLCQNLLLLLSFRKCRYKFAVVCNAQLS